VHHDLGAHADRATDERVQPVQARLLLMVPWPVLNCWSDQVMPTLTR
jgi:hypothetical protein